MKKLYTTLLFTIYTLISFGQVTFQDEYGQLLEDKGQVVFPMTDGRYCIVGSTGADMQDSSYIAVYFLNTWGDLLFSYKIGLAGNDFPVDAVETTDGAIIIVGKTFSSPLDTVNSDIFAVKIDSINANVIWSVVYGGSNIDEANSVIATPEGHFVISGNTMSYGAVNQSALSLKIDQNGDPIWCNVNSLDADNNFYSADFTSDNKYVMAGYSGNANNIDHYILKMDTNGTVLWGNKNGTNLEEISYDIKTTSDHGFVAAGSSTSNTAGNMDQTILKFDSAGAITWSKNFGSPQDDVLSSIMETPNNNFVACGTTDIDSSGNVLNQMVIEEISSSGSIVWSKTYGDSISESQGYCIIAGLDGGYGASGLDRTSDVLGDSYFVKTDANGMSGCNEFLLSLVSNVTALTNGANPVSQMVNINTSPVFMSTVPFADQFTQNCFWDNIHEKNAASFVKLFPNPAGNTLHIETALSNCVMTVMNGFGQIVYKNNLLDYNSSIDISFLSPGIYFVEVKSDKMIVTAKFVKQ